MSVVVNSFLTVGELLDFLEGVDRDARVRYSRRNADGTYGSMPLHDVCVDGSGTVFVNTYFTENGTIVQPRVDLFDF